MTIMSSILQNPQASIMSSLLSSTASAAVAIPDSLIRLQETYVGRDGSGGPSNTGDLVGFMADISQMGNVSIPAQPELVTNGTFNTDSGWNKGAGWVIGNGKATITAAQASLSQPFIPEVGVKYYIEYEVSDYSGGGVYIGFLGGTNTFLPTQFSNGVYSGVLEGISGNSTLYVGIGKNTTLSIDNISVKKHVDTVDQFLAGQTELVTNGDAGNGLTGWTSTNSTVDTTSNSFKVSATSGYGHIDQSISTSHTGIHIIEFDVLSESGTNQGVVNVYKNDVTDDTIKALRFGVGSHKIYVNHGAIDRIRFRVQTSGETVEFDNISVKALPGNHAIAPSDAARPTKTSGGFSLDGVNDILEMPKPSGDLTNCTVLMRWRRLNDDDQGVVFHDGTFSRYLVVYGDGSASAISSGSGIPTTKIDGVTVTDRDSIHAASSSFCDTVITSADLSSWLQFQIAGWNSSQTIFMPNIEIADRGFMVFDHTPADAEIEAAFASMGTLS